jgi:hypothetical protein
MRSKLKLAGIFCLAIVAIAFWVGIRYQRRIATEAPAVAVDSTPVAPPSQPLGSTPAVESAAAPVEPLAAEPISKPDIPVKDVAAKEVAAKEVAVKSVTTKAITAKPVATKNIATRENAAKDVVAHNIPPKGVPEKDLAAKNDDVKDAAPKDNELPKHRIQIAVKGKRNQIRAVVTTYPKTTSAWEATAKALATEAGGNCLVTFVDQDDLESWNGTAEVDFTHYLCRCRCDERQPVVFQKNPDRADVVLE